jgi:membrane protease subunit HflC
MLEIRDRANEAAADFGLSIVDVRIKRVDLPEENSQAIYRRMETERQQEAAQIRAEGDERALKIRSAADRDRTIILAEAEKQANILRGEGDGEAVRIFAEAFGKDEEFFSFYRSMQAYRKALGQSDTTMVLSPDSEFFEFFDAPKSDGKR